MASNGRRAAAGAAVLAVGGVIAHSAGVLSKGADDAARASKNLDDAGHVIDDLPPSEPPIRIPDTPPPVDPPPVAPALTRDEVDSTLTDETTTDVVCSALDFLDTVGDEESTFEDYAEWAYDEVSQLPRDRAARGFEAAESLYYEGDPNALVDIYCEF